MVSKIALEEHFLSPGLRGLLAADDRRGSTPMTASNFHGRLTDFGEHAPRSMDGAGIARCGAGDRGPRRPDRARHRHRARGGARIERFSRARDRTSVPTAIRASRHLAMQDPRGGRRGAGTLHARAEFCGAMINGHTHGQYLDHPALYPFWERADALRRGDLPPSRRSGGAAAGAHRLQGTDAADLGLGLRDRLACAAPRFWRTFRPLSARAG